MSNMLSPSVNLALCLAVFTPSALSGSSVSSPQHRSLRVEPEFLEKRFLPEDPEHFYGNLKCGVTVQVGKDDHKFEMCPEQCPYYAQDLEDDLHCSFVCVPATECAVRNPKRPIADIIKGHKTCRGPIVSDCEEYNYDGTDSCKKCQWLYSVKPDGLCHFDHYPAVWTCIVIFGAITVFLLLWVIDCCVRPRPNKASSKYGEDFRHLQKILNKEGKLYDFNSNLCSKDVAGPGMLLHFRFQVFVIVWAFVIALIWCAFCIFIDADLWILGTRRFGTPRENCILVAWGYHTQQRLMWTKVTFLVITYIFTFVSTMAHAIAQQHKFETLDSEEKTMKDFMGYMTGVSALHLTADQPDAEFKIEQWLREECKVEGLIGVSIAWNYNDKEDDVANILERDMLERNQRKAPDDFVETASQERVDEIYSKLGPVRKILHKAEKWMVDYIAPPADKMPDVQEMLKEIHASDEAFVVFNTEDQRNKAVEEIFADKELSLGDAKLTLTTKVCEPDTILWENYGESTLMQRLWRLFLGFGAILLALFFWTTVFYAPYAYQVFCFNYDNGAQPPWTLALTFCMVVVLGNAIMYEVCARVADFIGFKTRDDRESCYLILYVIACMFNVCLDMVTTYFLAEYILDGLGFRTVHGVRFQDVPTFMERFETYAMQRMLAENTKAYSFPATFLIPFLIEPFITVIFPYMGGKVMVETHEEWVGRDAELWMKAFDFDMGRYGDLLLDMVLGILIFFFPGGYTWILFFGMAGSHAYIYFFDHARVLRTIPKCIYASIDVDWWACWMMAPITAMIPMCLVFKANCQGYGFCIKGMPLVECMWAAYFAHTVLHTLLLLYVVPVFKPDGDGAEDNVEWATAAQGYDCNWFTANAIHCIRSKELKLAEDNPATSEMYKKTKDEWQKRLGKEAEEPKATEDRYCSAFRLGKSQYLNCNPQTHCYFKRDSKDDFNAVAQSGKAVFSGTKSSKGE